MAVIINHIPTDKKYIMIGAGFAAYKTAKSSVFIVNKLPREDEGEINVVAVCDEEGQVQWLDSEEIEVVEVDGESPKELLG